jgi:hypothetical protein
MEVYANRDNDLARDIYKMLYPMISQEERDIINLTVRGGVEPTLVLDGDVLVQVRDDAVAERNRAIKNSGLPEKVLSSNPQFAAHIRSLGLTPPTKLSEATGEETEAFAKGDDEFVSFMLEYPQYKHIWDGRLAAKSNINITRAEKFLTIYHSSPDHTTSMPLNYCGAHTGRHSGCLVAETEVLVYTAQQEVVTKRIVDVQLSDLVWDGIEFVEHEGVKFSGFREVISHSGITGTEEHGVFTEIGEVSLFEAMCRGAEISVADAPTTDAINAAKHRYTQYKM